MSNPARRLAALLSEWEDGTSKSVLQKRGGEDRNDLHFWQQQREAVDLVQQVEALLAGMKENGADVEPYEYYLPVWYQAVFSYTGGWTLAANSPNIERSALDMLKGVATLLDQGEIDPDLDADQLADLENLLAEAEELIADAPLPSAERVYLWALVSEARECVREYAMFGSSRARRIAVELGGAMTVSVHHVEDEEKRAHWKGVVWKLFLFFGGEIAKKVIGAGVDDVIGQIGQ